MTSVLDSWAIVRYLQDDQPAAEQVAAVLDVERPVVSWINLGEVFYVVRRAAGDDAAMSTLRDLGDVVTAEVPNPGRIVEAARIKVEYPMAYADAFAAAAAAAHGGVLDRCSRTARPRRVVAKGRSAIGGCTRSVDASPRRRALRQTPALLVVPSARSPMRN